MNMISCCVVLFNSSGISPPPLRTISVYNQRKNALKFFMDSSITCWSSTALDQNLAEQCRAWDTTSSDTPTVQHHHLTSKHELDSLRLYYTDWRHYICKTKLNHKWRAFAIKWPSEVLLQNGRLKILAINFLIPYSCKTFRIICRQLINYFKKIISCSTLFYPFTS